MTRDEAAPRETYRSSSFRHLLLLIGSLGFVGASIFVATHGGIGAAVGGTLGAGFFGLNAAVFAAIVLRPLTLVLDPDGFELAGGLLHEPHRTSWREVREFRVWRSGRWAAPKIVAYDFVSGWEPPANKPRVAQLLKFNRQRGWPDAGLPAMWSISAIALCKKLNDYKARATAAEVNEG
jgi:hypothetical protein